MKLLTKLTFIAGIMGALSAHAGGSVDLSLSNDAARLSYDAAMLGSGSHISMSGLHHIDNGDMASLGFHVVGQRDASSPFYVGLGGQVMANYFNYREQNQKTKKYFSLGLGVGGFVRYNFPFHEQLGVGAHVYYSPRVITFADAKAMVDLDLRVQYSIIPSAHAYLGYRYNASDIEKVKGWSVIDDGLHVGLRLNF